MQRRSPPKHRHDGASPLPLGMDWSPPPRNWNGRDTIWPHDFRTGWSYCVTIPSWTLLSKSKNSDPIVFYRVQVSVQSPEGVSTMRGILRRFNDFVKLLADLKRAFPRKSFPSAPPKGFLRVKSRDMLEERRCSLEDWMTKLLSDIELARSVVVASFLELEATARSACQVVDQNASDSNDDGNSTSLSSLVHPNSGGSSLLSSDYGSDTAYETSELGSASLGQDDVSETDTGDLTLDEDLTNPTEKLVKFSMSNIDEGLSMSQTIIEQLEDFPKHRVHLGYANDITETNSYNGKASKGVFRANNDLRRRSESETSHSVMHDRKLSLESADGVSLLAGETSTSSILSSIVDSQLDVNHDISVGNLEIPDMEDLIARLNQETAVKEYLNRKVDDLEVELETTKQRNKENLEQALMTERQSFTKMQWDMEELRQKTFEMELKLKSKEDGSSDSKTSGNSTISESHELLQEMDATKQQLEDLSRRYVELEAKSKADIKVLVREVKSLRRSHMEMEKELTRSLTEKSDTEKLLQQERIIVENTLEARRRLYSDCKILHDRLKVNNTNLSMDESSNNREDLSEVSNALQDQIEAQLLLGFDETASEDELRKIMADIEEIRKMGTEVSTSPTSLIDQTVVPGDVVLDLSNMTNQTIKLGSGLRQDNEVISVMRAGKLRYSKPNKYWVESSHKRYVPRPEDHVLGIVVDCKGENYWIDIKGPQLALLPVLAFEGANRRNYPKFEAILPLQCIENFPGNYNGLCVILKGSSTSLVSTLLYTRVVKTNTGMNPELSCVDESGKAAGFGPLKDGFMFETSTGLSRMLLSSPTCPVLEALGKKLSFETAFGLNGRCWVHAAAPRIVIIVANALMNSETLSGTQQRIMVEKLLEKISD
ncbi:unnamed protein product [Arabidopsis thaliana]|uniref:Ribosomal RNA-processing protein 40 n=1 Tax=Arabidopsis thaliana TaxID=3702 RepID=A0A7G2EEV6_ARATH|nr:unnamed protein product [Arabidopsis thaliana]